MDITLSHEQVAMICHEAHRAFCAAMGDTTIDPWDKALDYQRQSAIAGIKAIAESDDIRRAIDPERLHESWLENALRTGWRYGEVKDREKKTHPALLPWKALSDNEKAKSALFGQTAACMLGLSREFRRGKVSKFSEDLKSELIDFIKQKVGEKGIKTDDIEVVHGQVKPGEKCPICDEVHGE